MKRTLIHNVNIVNEGRIFKGWLIFQDGLITALSENTGGKLPEAEEIIDGGGKYLLPGIIDDQVHFREPGLTHKGDIHSESRAAVAGGVTSYMEMPNTVPNTLTQSLLEQKYKLASENSFANYSFFMGASNDNLEEVLLTDPHRVCGIKIFMASSTGDMLVDNHKTLDAIFASCKMLIAVHCEDEVTIRNNTQIFREKYGEDVPVACHPLIRSAEACYKSSSFAVQLAKKHNTRLHVLHISTARETDLFENTLPLHAKRITAEACIHHLWFSDEDYQTKGNLIKWNPAVKTKTDQDAILKAVLDNRIDVIATDHAPHTLEEKNRSYFKAPSGGPLVQHSLVALLEMHKQGKITLEKIVEKMCHAVSDCFRIKKRGYLRIGYHADLVLVDLHSAWTVNNSNIYAKCGWSPFEGTTFSSRVTHTFVNGRLVYHEGQFDEQIRGERLLFEP
jgi:dihydroorotase